jgi:hypothetical protein
MTEIFHGSDRVAAIMCTDLVEMELVNAISTVAMPAACSFTIPIICSSLNLLRLMRPTALPVEPDPFPVTFQEKKSY